MSNDPKMPNTLNADNLEKLKRTFMKKVNKDSHIRPYESLSEDCWLWMGCIEANGGGVFQSDLCKVLNMTKAHRLAMYLLKPEEWNDTLDVPPGNNFLHNK